MHSKFPISLLALSCFLLCPAISLPGEPTSRVISFENGLTMDLLEESGRFLGIGAVRIDGYILRSGESPVFPLVAADWSYPQGLYADLRLAEVRAVQNGWELVIELRECADQSAWGSFFLSLPYS
ncbi:MAG: hypothetical protein ACP5I4_02740 [Oceanipulchritudo sp.]